MRYGIDKITKIEKTSQTVVTLPLGSVIPIGGQRRFLSSSLTLDISVSGLGGMEAAVAGLTFYYVYAVESSGAVHLIASTSEIKPSSYNAYRKVGAFYTNSSAEVFRTRVFGIEPKSCEGAFFDGATANSTGAVIPVFQESTEGLINKTTSVRGSTSGEYNVRFGLGFFAEKPIYSGTVVADTNGFNNSGMVVAEDNGDPNDTNMDNGTPGVRIKVTRHDNAQVHWWFTLDLTYQGVDAIKPDWNHY